MMLPTHALAGMALAVPVARVAPEFAGVAFVAGLVGGVLPDLDLYAGHRKTLHFPVYYPGLAAFGSLVAVLVPTTATVAAAMVLLGAAAHCIADVFGGGLELRPWEATSERAVYDHLRGRWIAPRRVVSYDGSPGDLLVSLALAVPLSTALDGPLRWLVAATIAVAFSYAVVRRALPVLAEQIVAALPTRALAYLPERYHERGSRTSP